MVSAHLAAPIFSTTMTKQQPLRRPKNSSQTALSQYAEIKDTWRNFRDRVLSLKRESYFSQGKALATELQTCMQRNQRDINKVVHIVYERATKDLHSYPIAALLFEDLGNEVEDSFGGERILDELQKQIQKSLSALNNKLGRMEKLVGTDVGIVFLLFLLYKLENLRKGDGSIFTDLLIKLFKQFHVYMLGASKWPHSDFSSSVLSAVCVLLHVTNTCETDSKVKIKIKQILGLLRSFYISGSLKGLGKIQVLWTIESLSPRKGGNGCDEFYRQQYITACKKSNYLLDALDTVLSDTDVEKNLIKEDVDKYTISKEEKSSSDRTDSTEALNISNDSSDVFLDDDSRINAQHITLSKTTEKDKANVIDHADELLNSKVSCLTKAEDSKDSLTSKTELKNNMEDVAEKCIKESVSSAEFRKLIEVGINEVPSSSNQQEISESIKVPDECIERIVGYQGAILRKLEYQSQATISLDIEKILRFETERPETSSLTAHRLVAAALGMSPKLDEEKSKAENEKLAFARDVASRYKVSTKQHDVKISGSPDAVSTAKKLINQIVNFTTLLAVPLPGFAIDEVIEISGAKLKTIETLLNVILRLEELDDQSVVLHLSGDAVSCEDAKKLILEELGQVSAAQGQLMLLPGTLRHILTTKESMDRFIRKLGDLSGARIRLLTDEKCRFLFFTGYSDRVYKARRIINKINTNLLFTPADSTQSGTSDDDNDKAKSKTVEYVLHTMEDLCKREHSLSRQVSQDQVPHVSKRKFYSRLFLVHRWSSPEAWKFPDSLQKILDGNDEESKMIIVKEGIPMCDLLFLTSEEGPSRTRPSIS